MAKRAINPVEHTIQCNYKMSPSLLAEFDNAALHNHMTRSEALREAMRMYMRATEKRMAAKTPLAVVPSSELLQSQAAET